MNVTKPHQTWDVLLLGGASGVGKTSVSYRLAHHFGVGITEIDDFQVVLETLTTPEQQPVLHYWLTHPEAGQLSAEKIVEQTVAVGHTLAPALHAVILNHLETHTPLVLEGDFLLLDKAVHRAFTTEPNVAECKRFFYMKLTKRSSAPTSRLENRTLDRKKSVPW